MVPLGDGFRLSILVDFAMSYVDSVCSNPSQEEWTQIQDSITRFVQHEWTLEECQQALLATIHSDVPVVRLHEVLSVPDEPLPSPTDELIQESSVPMRRRTRPWNVPEDRRLLAGVARYGVENWQQVAAFVGNGRNRAQCSQRWTRCLNPRISNRPWTAKDEEQLRDLVSQHGEKSWAKISGIIGNRSDVQCRYHYRQMTGHNTTDKTIPLMNKSMLTSSINLFQEVEKPPEQPQAPPPVPDVEHEEGPPITLVQSRACVSTPMIARVGGQIRPQPLLLPLSPLRNLTLPKFTEGSALQESGNGVKWNIVGSYSDSLNSFLSRFQ
jgi:hypothetical protein